MKLLSEILKEVKHQRHGNMAEAMVRSLQLDSRLVKAGDCFIAVRGTQHDGHRFIQSCVERGVVAIVCELLPDRLSENVAYILVKDASRAAGEMAANFFDRPSLQLKVVGVTGTNGKTSVATLLYGLFTTAGYRCGLVSTVQNMIAGEVLPSTHTTPDAIRLQQLLSDMVKSGCGYCFMEVSSHAMVQNRTAGVHFCGGIFTNITHDHLDYHKTFEAYLKAKKKFFDELPASAFALVNADDRNSSMMLQNTAAKKYSYALRSPADFKTRVIENPVTGLHLETNGTELYTRLVGEFNASNITAVFAAASLLGMEKTETLTRLSALAPPEGRFDQTVSATEKVVGIVDYAHTPDALKNVLQTIQAIRKGNEQVITLVGCGGDRDAAKRPVMAEIACRYSDRVVLTSDNPRSENPDAILDEMSAGVPVSDKRKVLRIADRREAIKTAVMLSRPNDIILLAGKGHEKYQEVNGVKHPFDDKAELQKFFTELNK